MSAIFIKDLKSKDELLTKNSSFPNPISAEDGCELSWGREANNTYQVYTKKQLLKFKATIDMTTGKEKGYKSPTGRFYVIRGRKLIACWKVNSGKFTTNDWGRM